MKLIHDKTGAEVKIGDAIQYRWHNAPETDPFETLYVSYIQKPKHGGSTGLVYASAKKNDSNARGFYPSVYNMTWIDRDDQ